MAPTDPTDHLVATRRALHVVAEQVFLPDLFHHTGRMGLRTTVGGFGTPSYPHDRGHLRRLRVEGTDVVDERDGQVAQRFPLAAPMALGHLRRGLGVTAPPPADVYDLATEGHSELVLAVDPPSAQLIATLFAVAQDALGTLGQAALADPGRPGRPTSVGSIQLWPEHFDLRRSIDTLTYGVSPGHDAHPEPHLYVITEGPDPDDPGGRCPPLRRSARPVPRAGQVLAWFLDPEA